MADYTNQINLFHFSDLHFGSKNICNPEDSTASSDGIPSLGDIVREDIEHYFEEFFDNNLNEDYAPNLIAVSGDFTQKAEYSEFEEASKFLENILSIKNTDKPLSKSDIFMVPGNHDVTFDKQTAKERFQAYCNFYNEFYEGVRPSIFSKDALSISQVHVVTRNDNKVLIAEVNCCMYVQNDTIDKSRGQVAMDAIAKLRNELESIRKKGNYNDYIKVAIIHHHVVLIPSFIEPNRGVDSVMNARHLLELFSEFNFHVILHGHKHYPHVFSYDPLPLWDSEKSSIPQLVLAGGSCGSSELPFGTSSCNTYSAITIKWHPNAQQLRVKVITRGLKTIGSKGKLSPDQWSWGTVNISDKVISPNVSLPTIGPSAKKAFTNDERISKYEHLRGQMPVVEVMPSLLQSQAYEARAWIVSHGPKLNDEKKLIKVEWSAGKYFAQQEIGVTDNTNFCIAYNYWAPMLIEAKLIFKDGYEAKGYVYARLPQKN
jgi:3',5'-cyclic AMP phosphodiesterase CpdA